MFNNRFTLGFVICLVCHFFACLIVLVSQESVYVFFGDRPTPRVQSPIPEAGSLVVLIQFFHVRLNSLFFGQVVLRQIVDDAVRGSRELPASFVRAEILISVRTVLQKKRTMMCLGRPSSFRPTLWAFSTRLPSKPNRSRMIDPICSTPFAFRCLVSDLVNVLRREWLLLHNVLLLSTQTTARCP